MRMVDLIQKKKNKLSLSKEEIYWIIENYSKGNLPDYQIAAWLMSVYFNGMTKDETANLTMAIVESGEQIDLSGIKGVKVDKHSTGGVGDKISLIIAPLVASVGVPVAKLSGRGLGHTGGTIDKLESIEGFHVELSKEQFVENVNKYKLAVVGQTANITPADKKLYALRDVTATVDSIPLIASSIMSKKIASGANSIVLDVKAGSGAFMKTVDGAIELAREMVDIGKNLNRKTIAVITNMNQPLGHQVGNANEVIEAIETLKGNGPEDLEIIALTISSYMTVLGGVYPNFETAYKQLQEIIKSGKAIDTFKSFIKAQGGNPDVVDNYKKFPHANFHLEVKAEREGYVSGINAELIGIAAMMLGAGRKTKEDRIDYSAGITINKKIGDMVQIGDVLCILHTNIDEVSEAIRLIKEAYTFSSSKPAKEVLIHDVIM